MTACKGASATFGSPRHKDGQSTTSSLTTQSIHTHTFCFECKHCVSGCHILTPTADIVQKESEDFFPFIITGEKFVLLTFERTSHSFGWKRRLKSNDSPSRERCDKLKDRHRRTGCSCKVNESIVTLVADRVQQQFKSDNVLNVANNMDHELIIDNSNK